MFLWDSFFPDRWICVIFKRYRVMNHGVIWFIVLLDDSKTADTMECYKQNFLKMLMLSCFYVKAVSQLYQNCR
jgi:hypothetical protein